MTFTFKVVGLIVIVVSFYSLRFDRIASFFQLWIVRLPVARKYSLDEVNNIIQLLLSGIAQLVLCFSIILILKMDLQSLGLTSIHPVRIVYGIFLGIGELALGSLLAHTAMRVAMRVFPEKVPTEFKEWLTLARAGWMRLYRKTVAVAPLPVVFAVILVYIAGEEILFRGVLYSYLLHFGPFVAIAGSTSVFAIVQIFHMPSWQSAMFPVIGALMLGTLHGLLFFAVQDMAPLIVAHFFFLLMALA